MRLLALALTLCAAASADDAHPVLAIGAKAPDFSLPGIDGKVHKLAEYASAPVLAIVFTCNHCPTAQLYEGRIKKLADDYRGKGVTLVAIEPNDATAIRLDELGYTDVSDSLEEMKIRADDHHFNFPYLYDGDTQTTAKAYGCLCTPHVFLFDRDRRLVYRGQLDDSRPNRGAANGRDLREAIEAVLMGKPAAANQKPSSGCGIKWKR